MYNNNMNDEVLDSIIKAACYEYIQRELSKVPSDEELARMYPPYPKKSLKKALRKLKEIEYGKPLIFVYLQRVAVILLVTATLCFSMFLMNERVRAAIADTVATWFDKYVRINFANSESGSESEAEASGWLDGLIMEAESEVTDPDQLTINYIPEGFELTDTTENIGRRRYMYFSETGDYITIGIDASNITESFADIEYSEYEKTSINGIDAYITYDNSTKSGMLVMGNTHYTISIMCISDKNELIKIAENIK